MNFSSGIIIPNGGYKIMKYSQEEKSKIIYDKPQNMDVRTYCNSIGLSYSSYYKWINELKGSKPKSKVIDITNVFEDKKSKINCIDLECNNIIIHVNENCNETQLLNIIKLLKRL